MDIKLLFLNSLFLVGTAFAITFTIVIINATVSSIRKQKMKDKIDMENYKIILDKSIKKTLKSFEDGEL